jgi:hypothetical protein
MENGSAAEIAILHFWSCMIRKIDIGDVVLALLPT